MNLKGKQPTEKEVQEICDKLNEAGITKDQLDALNNIFKK